jgi:dTDP-4-dehydrorhamnose 3,5-epimerase-like enzyme
LHAVSIIVIFKEGKKATAVTHVSGKVFLVCTDLEDGANNLLRNFGKYSQIEMVPHSTRHVQDVSFIVPLTMAIALGCPGECRLC